MFLSLQKKIWTFISLTEVYNLNYLVNFILKFQDFNKEENVNKIELSKINNWNTSEEKFTAEENNNNGLKRKANKTDENRAVRGGKYKNKQLL